MIVFGIFLALIISLLAVALIRTAMFKPKAPVSVNEEAVTFDNDACVAALQKLVQCKTVSYHDSTLEDNAEFERLIDLLPSLYPEVFRVCSFERLPDQS